ncbi:uncharacterized protein LOC120000656 [Tripterygium wilfordii]|uniref:uncharacterized protein LOC120000656 n=1 Tax=Tripterygium wilfordii TaxID=458696 RepID=UPI0018F7F419|nr:uncharacterized protein LOC120000656 [Tripterygium wilfordii]
MRSQSRIDRAFASVEWFSTFPSLRMWGLPRGLSDHSPLLIETEKINWGPKPFRVLDCWWQHPWFLTTVQVFWQEIKSHSPNDLQLFKKFQLLKKLLRIWNTEVFGNVEKKVAVLESEVDKWHLTAEERSLSEREIEEVRALESELWKECRKKECIWNQKSRVKWTVEDEQSDYLPWEGLRFKLVPDNVAASMELPFSNDEIRKAVWSCEGNKAPGPDGFNFNFIKRAWDIIEDDVYGLVHKFYASGKLPQGVNSSFITLVPKISGASKLTEFRPISLVGSLYKIVSKSLAERLKTALPYVISESQSTFMKGRQILDNILIANEVVHFIERRKKKGLLFKLDLEKAFDFVNWRYLDMVMLRMGFGVKWRSWIMECVSTACVSILVNGSPTKEIRMQKGIRQGDPLSPFLFNIAAEGLHQLFTLAEEKGLLKGIVIKKDALSISHIQYADDTLIFCKAKESSIQMVKRILRCYQLISGLKVNFSKSSLIGIGLDRQWTENMAAKHQCRAEALPVKYLGIPLGANFKLAKTWKPVVDNFQKSLAKWKGRQLSIGGRLTLVKAALSNLPIYYMSLFKMPVSVARKLESLQRNFLWGDSDVKKKLHRVNWKQVIQPKNAGGLGIGDITLKNKALLFKWAWRFLKNEGAFWRSIISGKYTRRTQSLLPSLTIPISPSASYLWHSVQTLVSSQDSFCGRFFQEGIGFGIGNGSGIKFWQDRWVANRPLCEIFERLFRISLQKACKIEEMGYWSNNRWQWSFLWRRPLYRWEETKTDELLQLLSTCVLCPNKKDRVIWLYTPNGDFTVKSLYGKLVEPLGQNPPQLGQLSYNAVWKSLAPPRVEIFVWILLFKKLPTRDNLTRKGIILASVVWSIWKERNDVIFRGKVVDWVSLLPMIFVRLQRWAISLDPHFIYSSLQLQHNVECVKNWSNQRSVRYQPYIQWIPPHGDILKWNVDGSALGKPGRAGIGGVLRDSFGSMACLFSCSIGVCESNEAELRAIYKALDLTASSSSLIRRSVIIESDSLNAVKWVAEECDPPWKLGQIANSIILLRHKVPSISLQHTLRGRNDLADLLAKEGTRRSSDFLIWF